MILNAILAVACIVLFLSLRRSKRHRQELNELVIKQSQDTLTETERFNQLRDITNRLMRSVSGTFCESQFILERWNAAPEYARTHPDETEMLVLIHEGVKHVMSNWIHVSKASGLSGEELDHLRHLLRIEEMKKDDGVLRLYRTLDIAPPVKLRPLFDTEDRETYFKEIFSRFLPHCGK